MSFKPGQTVVLHVRAMQRKAPQRPPEILEMRGLCKGVINSFKKLESKIKNGEDDGALFDINKIPFKRRVESIDPKLLTSTSRTELHGLTIRLLDILPALEYSLERKKAFILFKVFNLDGLQNPDKSDDISKALIDLAIKDNKEREKKIIEMAIAIGKEANPTPYFLMANEYLDLLGKLKLDDIQKEKVVNTHGNKTLDLWIKDIKRSLEKVPEPNYARSIVTAKNGFTNGTHTPKAVDKPVIASTLIAEESPVLINSTEINQSQPIAAINY